MTLSPLLGAETDKELEDDLDAPVPQKTSSVSETKKEGNNPVEAEPEDAKLAAIVLPEHPTKADVVKYLKALHAYGERMPRVPPMGAPVGAIIKPPPYPIRAVKKKLAAVPTQYIGEAIGYAAKENGFLSFRHAIVDLVNDRKDLDDSHRETVLTHLPKCPDLIVTVARYGWATGQEKTVLKTARVVQDMGTRQLLHTLYCRHPESYVPLLVEYGSADAKELVMELLTNRKSAREMASCFSALPAEEVPWLNRAEIVAKAWKKAQEGAGSGNSGPEQYAVLAAKYGHVDALIFIARKLNGAPDRSRSDKDIRAKMSEALPTLVPSGGANQEAIIRFVLANRTKLVFDNTLKQYRL